MQPVHPLAAAALLVGCGATPAPPPAEPPEHTAIVADLAGPLGAPLPTASDAQLEAFDRGLRVADRRFGFADGLGPRFNVTFCGACHEKPVSGGGAGLYRNFLLGGDTLPDGAFVPKSAGGVVRLYAREPDGPVRPRLDPVPGTLAQRNPIPFFGVGLLAELSGAEILGREDPDDTDGDGVSGRANWDQGFVGRFGRKSQTVSIEGFIRGPLINHLGITTDPLSEEQKAALPVDSSSRRAALLGGPLHGLRAFAQAAAPASPTTDADGVPDPEMSTDDLFDLVSFAMLLAAPAPDPPSAEAARGAEVFDALGCWRCHTPRLQGPRGPLHVYSDLLLHDMGPELADGLSQGLAGPSEFRTQPLWGLAPVGPYLHDGRAATVAEAIELHGGEGAFAASGFLELDDDARSDLLAFLDSLGGRDLRSAGMLLPGAPVPEVGEAGGPARPLTGDDAVRYRRGRELFDAELRAADGLGAPRFNGDSCRACHFDPVLGGAGPRGVDVVRHGLRGPDGAFSPPSIGTILHRQITTLRDTPVIPQADSALFELRQTPTLLGLGLIEGIAEDVIVAGADPNDARDGDGVSGRAARVDGGRLGRFGWKAQVPSLAEFVRDAVSSELGITLPWQEGRTFGRIHDSDDRPDPEMSADKADDLLFFLRHLGPPPRRPSDDPQGVARGAQVFEEVGCAACHVPSLPGADGPVPLFSDLLLHEVLPEGAASIEEGAAGERELRTPPLWGLSATAPYLHDGAADTLIDAIEAHAGEATGARDRLREAPEADREALLVFLGSL